MMCHMDVPTKIEQTSSRIFRVETFLYKLLSNQWVDKFFVFSISCFGWVFVCLLGVCVSSLNDLS